MYAEIQKCRGTSTDPAVAAGSKPAGGAGMARNAVHCGGMNTRLGGHIGGGHKSRGGAKSAAAAGKKTAAAGSKPARGAGMVRDAVRCVGVLTRTDGRPQKPRWGEIGGGGGGRQKKSGGTRWHPQSCGMGDEVQVNGVVVVAATSAVGRKPRGGGGGGFENRRRRQAKKPRRADIHIRAGRMKNEVLLNSIIVVADLHDGEAPARKVAVGAAAQRRSNRAWASRPRFRAPWMMFEAKVCSSEAHGAIIHSAAAAALSAPSSGGCSDAQSMSVVGSKAIGMQLTGRRIWVHQEKWRMDRSTSVQVAVRVRKWPPAAHLEKIL
ncbi:hypothetical protein B0H11DRAFT_1911392 [Mycena galericulata]|nr:hypothetical protein B0H11DRAFT_1911392 [Mycena galericulata]